MLGCPIHLRVGLCSQARGENHVGGALSLRKEAAPMHASATPKGSAAAAVLCAASTPKGSAQQDMLRAAYTLEGLCAASSLPFVLS